MCRLRGRRKLKRSPALRSTLIRGLTKLDVTTSAGIYLGTAPTVRLDRKRLDRTVKRIVAALHWHHYGRVPNPGVKFAVTMGPNPKRPGVAERVARDLLGGRRWSVVGGGVFRYAYGQVPEAPDWRAWLLTFHSTAFALVVLSKDEDDSEEAE